MMDESAALAVAIERIDLLTKMTLGLQDEIARLTQTYADYRDIARASTIESIQAISRYRAALEQIAAVDPAQPGLYVEVVSIARAALEGNT